MRKSATRSSAIRAHEIGGVNWSTLPSDNSFDLVSITTNDDIQYDGTDVDVFIGVDSGRTEFVTMEIVLSGSGFSDIVVQDTAQISSGTWNFDFNIDASPAAGQTVNVEGNLIVNGENTLTATAPSFTLPSDNGNGGNGGGGSPGAVLLSDCGVEERPVFDDFVAFVTVENDTGESLDQVVIDVWLNDLDGEIVGSETISMGAGEVVDVEVPFDPPSDPGTYEVIVEGVIFG